MVQQAAVSVQTGQLGGAERCVPAQGGARKTRVEGPTQQEGVLFDSLFRQGLPGSEQPEGLVESLVEENGVQQPEKTKDPEAWEEEDLYEAVAMSGMAAQLPPTAPAGETETTAPLSSEASIGSAGPAALVPNGPGESIPAPAETLTVGQPTGDDFQGEFLPTSGQAGPSETAEGAISQPVIHPQPQDKGSAVSPQRAEPMADTPVDARGEGERTPVTQEGGVIPEALTTQRPEGNAGPVLSQAAEAEQPAPRFQSQQRQEESLAPSIQEDAQQTSSLPVQKIPPEGQQTAQLLTDAGKDSPAGPPLGEAEPEKQTADPTQSVLSGISAALTRQIQTQGEGETEYSAAVSKALNRFVESFRDVGATPSQIRIVLEPEELGSLVITVASTQGKITAKIQSEDKEVCAAITQQLQELVSALESKGVSVQDVDVVYGGIQQSLDFAQSGFGARQEQSLPHRSFGRPQPERVAAPGFFELWQAPMAADRDTTVEYRI